MISNTAILKFPQYENVVAAGVKILEQCKLSVRAGRRRKAEDAVVNYMQDSIREGDTVLDIGTQESNIYFMRRKLKRSGRIIAFGFQPSLYRHLFQLKKTLGWKNVDVELARLSNITGTTSVYNTPGLTYNSVHQGAVIINMNEHINTDSVAVQTLDDYCTSGNIRPHFLKIDAGGNELTVLRGAFNTLKTHKPRILLRCEERLAGAENVVETFRLLLELGYTGYFVLDTIRIPLVNFDFNVYQNPCKNFYCSNFMFE